MAQLKIKTGLAKQNKFGNPPNTDATKATIKKYLKINFNLWFEENDVCSVEV